MINLSFDTSTDIAKIQTPATFVLGADVPIRLHFNAAPGQVQEIILGLGSDATSAVLLAVSPAFTEENALDWVATLNGNDARLVEYMTGRGPTAVNLELVCKLNGKRRVAPHLSVTVQPPILPLVIVSSGDQPGTGDGDTVTTGDGDEVVVG